MPTFLAGRDADFESLVRLFDVPLAPMERHVLEDDEQRSYFKLLPTSFTLKDDDVDRLREAGRSILLESPDFQRLVRQLQ